jgi:hypothetical protein
MRRRIVPNQRQTRGAALVMAVAVLGVVAASCLALLLAVGNDFKRGRLDQDRLQLEQYELASIAIAHAQLRDERLVEGILPLPPEAGNATIEWEATAPNRRAATVTIAGLERRYTFDLEAGKWRLTAAH